MKLIILPVDHSSKFPYVLLIKGGYGSSSHIIDWLVTAINIWSWRVGDNRIEFKKQEDMTFTYLKWG